MDTEAADVDRGTGETEDEEVEEAGGSYASPSYALLADGRCVLIRPATPDDWQAVHDFAAELGRRSVYRRFFGYVNHPGKLMADAACAPAPEGMPKPRGALLGLLDGVVVGLAEWIRAADPQEAEIAFAVADRLQGHGMATLLAEHLIGEAARAGIHRFSAITQAENRAMIEVFATLGLPVSREWDYGTVVVSVPLDLHAAECVALLDAAARRERIADDASLRHLLAPDSVAVIGDPRDPATATLRRNLHAPDGRVWSAGPDGADLPADAEIELAVITSPPELAVQAARDCARRGVRAVIATSTGFDDATGHALLEACRAGGMRLLGPGSLGVINTDVPGGLNASLASGPLRAGPVGVAVQSGGVGLTILSHLNRLGIGIGTFAAVGDKYDVSANDLLMHWQDDPAIRLGLLHVESFGNPRKFARTARALSRRIPLLGVDPEQSPSQPRTALYAQAGITAVPSVGALVCAAALLAHQPAPRGRRVAVLGNTRGMVSLAVQACIKAGLDVATAVNLTPQADARRLAEAVAETVESEACDAVLVALAPTATTTIGSCDDLSLARDTSEHDVPVVLVLAEQAETVIVRRAADEASVPSYHDAAAAAAALAASAAAVCDRPDDPPPEPEGIDRASARRIVEDCLSESPRGRALNESEQAALLEAFGVMAAHDGAGHGDRGARRLTVIAWQDFVFGPLLTCARDGDSALRTTLLAPAGASDLADLSRRAVGGPPQHEHGKLTELLARVAALVDELPQIASLRLDVLLDDDGAVHTIGGDAYVTPARRADPYLRRLRRAPVE
jgi:acyl-CoA synthetase (NDP forming)/GNAT superfamily N-acetyltransferase